jgi:hypothetical protein
MHEQLDMHSVENRLIIYEGAGHPLAGCPTMREIREWFCAHGYPDIPQLPQAFRNIKDEKKSIIV